MMVSASPTNRNRFRRKHIHYPLSIVHCKFAHRKEFTMTKKKLYIVWGVMYVLCAALGFVPSPEGALYGLLFMLSLAFFIPPAVLLYRAVQRSDLATVRVVRTLSLVSLSATLVMLVVIVCTTLTKYCSSSWTLFASA